MTKPRQTQNRSRPNSTAKSTVNVNPVAPAEKVVVTSGAPIPLTRETLLAYIEKIKVKSPEKYAAKKKELEAKLELLK